MAVANIVPGREGDIVHEKRAGSRVGSGNRVKSRPAKDAVISGILSQLGELESPRIDIAARHTSFTRPDFSDFDQGSRPQSPAASLASAPIVPFSPSNAVRSTQHGSDGEDETFDDVATPPTVPIVRSSWRDSHQMTPRIMSYGGAQEGSASSSKAPVFLPSSEELQEVMSQSSVGASPKQEQQSPAMRTPQLRRVESHETLRQVQPDLDFQPDQDFIFNGLGSLATIPLPFDDVPITPSRRYSPKMLGKSRQYLQRPTEDMQYASASDLAVQAIDSASIRSDRSRGSSAGPSTPKIKKLRGASKPSPISDSIPLRTSSLRSSHSPASSKRRQKMKGTPRTGSLVRTISEDAQDEHWAELGEEDETVKRIRELRKKRESRLMSMGEESSATARSASLLSRDYHDDRASSTRAENALSSNKATNILGQQASSSIAKPFNAADPTGNSTSNVQGTGRLLQMRPTTPSHVGSSELRPLSLDYSYTQAVDALQSTSNNTSPQRRPPSRGMSAVRPAGFQQHRRTTSNTSANASPLRAKKQRGRLIANRFSEDGDEKGGSRRKSMSDARRPGDEAAGIQRRDSVESAVLNYLNNPRLSQHVVDPQTQRKISFSEVGDPKGAAVMVCVGMGLTRFVTAFFDELATTLRLRLITIERPGVGESEPYPPNDKSGPLMWASDVTAVTDHLGISKFSMLAHSAGAVYALGTALTLPHYVRGSIHLLAPWIPPSQLEAVSYPTDNSIPVGALPRSQRFLRVLPAPFLRMANNSYIFSSLKPDQRKSDSSNGNNHRRNSSESPDRCKTKRPTTASGPRPENPRRESMMLMDQFMPETNPMENFPLSTREDDKGEAERRRSSVFLGATINPNDPSFTFAGEALNAAEHSAREWQNEFSSHLTQRTWEYAIKDSNPAKDLLVCLERNREIGFRYTDVVRRVIITHGSEDKRVPVGNVKWLADQMNRAVISRYAVSRDTLSFDPGADPGCELRVLEGEGHGLMASPIIMADILTEIAGYWTAEERGRQSSQNL